MFIDTHCHLSKKYYKNIDEVIENNLKEDVVKIVVSACDVDEYEEVALLGNKYKEVYLCFGIHPEFASEYKESDFLSLKQYLTNTKKVVAVGEIGLDYYYTKENKDQQIELFRKQMALAEELNLPVVIHSRNSTEDTIKVLKEYKNVKGVIHCFSGSIETANIYISLGYKLGIGGVLTFKNSKLCEVVKDIALTNIVLETDSPYLTPHPFRGTLNSSKYIPVIAKEVANIKSITLDEVEDIVNNSTNEVFDFE